MPFAIRENSSHTAQVKTLKYSVEDTAEKCFFRFIDCGHETTYKTLRKQWLEYIDEMTEDDERPFSMMQYLGVDHIEGIFDCTRLFLISHLGGDSRVFGYNDEPDWNEMLEYAHGTVTSPRGAEAKYYIAEVQSCETCHYFKPNDDERDQCTKYDSYVDADDITCNYHKIKELALAK